MFHHLTFGRLLISLIVLCMAPAMAAPSHKAGALLFKVNCSLCHGALGLGDGYYPGLSKLGNTNLIDITKDTSKEYLAKAINGKSKHAKLKEFEPVDGKLNEKLINFLVYYFQNPSQSFSLLNNTVVYKTPDYNVGEAVYRRRCIICHGVKGDGKGRLSKIIKNPNPFDLRMSIISDGLLKQVIEQGGVIQGRNQSDTMPAFKNEISNFELESIMLYVKKFRDDTIL